METINAGTWTPEERSKAAIARFDEWERLRRVETNAEIDLAFRARGLIEDEQAGLFKTARQLRDAVHGLRAVRDALTAARDAANKFRLFGDCEHAGCAEAAHYSNAYPNGPLTCPAHEPKPDPSGWCACGESPLGECPRCNPPKPIEVAIRVVGE